jgi:type II secretory pathway pseudopilin PulG
MIRRIVVAGLIVLAALISAGGWYAWRWSLRAKQVRSCAAIYSFYVAVSDYRTRFGRYPSSLSDAVAATSWSAETKRRFANHTDAWGTPFRYSLNGSDFVLMSYGRDGRPSEGLNCTDLDADPVATAKGIERCCGK